MTKNIICLNDIKKYVKSIDENWNYVTSSELKKNKDKYFLLDVRRSSNYKQGHIKGSINIFWKNILNHIDKLPKNKTILVICYVGHTASQVIVILNLLGYKAKGLKFGMGISPIEGIPIAGWTNFGYPIVKN